MAPDVGVIAALLRQGRSLDHCSLALLLLGAVAGLAQSLLAVASPWLLTACLGLVLTGIVQKYFALRVALDAALFERLERIDTQVLDATLQGLGLLAPAKAGRPLQARAEGALRLLRRQALAFGLQLLLLLGALAQGLATCPC